MKNISVESPAQYLLRMLMPEDAAQIPELTRRVVGPSYVHDEVYHPNRLLRLNATGHLVTVVAVGPDGGLAGQCALERPELGPIAEIGEAMVLPEHRHHHLLDMMHGYLIDEAERLGLVGISADAVTHHVFSQCSNDKYGSVATGLMVGALPPSADHLEGIYPQRLSFLNYFKFLSAPAIAVTELPERHHTIVQRIYSRLGRDVEFRNSVLPDAFSLIEKVAAPARQRGTIKVHRAGADAAQMVETARRAMREESGIEAVFVELPLSEPGAAKVCEQLEARGFFFCGIKVGPPETGDVLRLQYVEPPIDFALIKIEGDFAKEVTAYVASERARTAH
jgi:hypothetical protein